MSSYKTEITQKMKQIKQYIIKHNITQSKKNRKSKWQDMKLIFNAIKNQ